MSITEIPSSKTVFVATGRRKKATARIRLYPSGSGKFTVNNKDLKAYCTHDNILRSIIAPLNTLETDEKFDGVIKVNGGGSCGQAGAIAHALARSLEKYNSEWRLPLKRAGHLKRDPRRRERKKPGQPGARKHFQFSKR